MKNSFFGNCVKTVYAYNACVYEPNSLFLECAKEFDLVVHPLIKAGRERSQYWSELCVIRNSVKATEKDLPELRRAFIRGNVDEIPLAIGKAIHEPHKTSLI
jgi:hypothetical protein